MTTALIVPLPGATAAVGGWLERTVAAVGVPPHVTLTVPFAPPDERLLADLRALAARFEPFEATLDRCARFATTLYLVPEPEQRFVELARAVRSRWPQYPPYGGAHGDEIVPHVTAAQGEPDVLDEAEAEIAPRLPLAARATELLLVAETAPLRWTAAASFPLGGRG